MLQIFSNVGSAAVLLLTGRQVLAVLPGLLQAGLAARAAGGARGGVHPRELELRPRRGLAGGLDRGEAGVARAGVDLLSAYLLLL